MGSWLLLIGPVTPFLLRLCSCFLWIGLVVHQCPLFCIVLRKELKFSLQFLAGIFSVLAAGGVFALLLIRLTIL